jgi:ATP-dependent DNA ligase
MAVHVGKNMRELEEMIESLGIDRESVVSSGKNGRLMKEDLINPIRDYHITQRYGGVDGMPSHMEKMLSVKSPMLAKRIDALKPEQQEEIWNSDDWYFEEKLNGCRMWIIKDESGLHLYSRHNSDVDFLPIEYTDKIILADGFDMRKVKENFILDCEVTSDESKLSTVVEKYGVVTETILQAVSALLSSDAKRARYIQKTEGIRLTFNTFDCVYYEGTWITDEPLSVRRRTAMELYKKLSAAGFKIKPVRSNRSNKKQFYKNIVMSGGEGVVAKNINGIYVPDTSRKNDGWIKIKRSMSGSLEAEESFGDTIDGWISGYEVGETGKALENFVATIAVSLYLNKEDGTQEEHEIARISGFDMKLREDMTVYVDGVPTLKPSYYGRVVEIDGAGVSARAKRLNHAQLIGFRYDKDKYSCTIDESFLNKMIL